MQPPDHPPYPQYPSPGQFTQPPRQPGRLRRFARWYRVQNIIVKFVVGVAILACVLFVCSATIAGVAQSISESDATPTAAVASQPTQAQATSTPTRPVTPTPTPTAKQRIQQLVTSNATDADKIDITQNDGRDVSVTITLKEALDQADARNSIQQNCFSIEKALWTAPLTGLDDVDLAFRGPATDAFGNPTTAPYGECDLSAPTAAKFNWSNLTPSTAWHAYDLAVFYKIIQS